MPLEAVLLSILVMVAFLYYMVRYIKCPSCSGRDLKPDNEFPFFRCNACTQAEVVPSETPKNAEATSEVKEEVRELSVAT
jgi:hypothetical protein